MFTINIQQEMKRQLKKFFVLAMLTSLIFSGCKSEEPTQPPAPESTTQAIQPAADKAHEFIDKAVTASQSFTDKAVEIQAIVRKAATDIRATLHKSSEPVTEKETESQEAPAAAEPHK